MSKRAGWLGASVTLVALAAASVSLGTGSAQAAVVYCKTVGVPKGCVARAYAGRGGCRGRDSPPWASHALASARRASVCVSGTPMNYCGPVNRVGRREFPALSLSGKRWGKVSLTCVPPGAGAQPQLRAAARGAALHIAQAAPALVAGDAPTVGHQLKTLAVIGDGDTALRAFRTNLIVSMLTGDARSA